MNQKLEIQFKRMLNERGHIGFKTAQKIKELRKKTFEDIKKYFENTLVFPQINRKIIRECSAFDRGSEIKKTSYLIDLFIDFSNGCFEIEKCDEDKFKVKINDPFLRPLFKDDCLTSQAIFKWFEEIPELECNIRNNQAVLTEENISLNIVPCLDFQDSGQEFCIVPYDEFHWKKLEINHYDLIGGNTEVRRRVIDNIIILKHWLRCQDFNDEELDYFLENSIIDYYNEHNPDEFLYEDFNTSLNVIYKNRTNHIANKTNGFDDELFVSKLKKSIDISNRMVNQFDDESLKCFSKIFHV